MPKRNRTSDESAGNKNERSITSSSVIVPEIQHKKLFTQSLNKKKKFSISKKFKSEKPLEPEGTTKIQMKEKEDQDQDSSISTSSPLKGKGSLAKMEVILPRIQLQEEFFQKESESSPPAPPPKCFLCQVELDLSKPDLIVGNNLKQCLSYLLGIRNEEIEIDFFGSVSKSCPSCYTICVESQFQLQRLIVDHRKLWCNREKIKDLLVEGNPFSRSINELCKSESSSKLSYCKAVKDPKIALLQCLNSFQCFEEIDSTTGKSDSPINCKDSESIPMNGAKGHSKKEVKFSILPGYTYKCPKCTRTFINKGKLNQHLPLHTETSVNCSKCGKLFGRGVSCGCFPKYKPKYKPVNEPNSVNVEIILQTKKNIKTKDEASIKKPKKPTEKPQNTRIPCRQNGDDPDFNFVFIHPQRAERLCSKSHSQCRKNGKLPAIINTLNGIRALQEAKSLN